MAQASYPVQCLTGCHILGREFKGFFFLFSARRSVALTKSGGPCLFCLTFFFSDLLSIVRSSSRVLFCGHLNSSLPFHFFLPGQRLPNSKGII